MLQQCGKGLLSWWKDRPENGSGIKRRDFLKASSVAALFSAVGAGNLLAGDAVGTTKTPSQSVKGTTPPVLQNVTETEATVIWGVGKPSTGWVEFGETEALGCVARGEVGGLLPYDNRVLRVRMTGLKPGRKYFYRVRTAPIDFKGAYDIHRGEGEKEARVYGFKTLDAQAATASFTVWNDTHQQKETLKKLIGHLGTYPSDFLMWNGDIFNHIDSEEMLIAETLFPAGQAYAAELPLVFGRGNHDVRGSYARMLARTLEARGGQYHFTFRQGPVAFLVLDTGEDKEDANPTYAGLGDFAGYRLAQQRWLEQAIETPEFKSAPFRVLFTHIPLRGFAHSSDSRAKWEALLAKARIDFAISGHTHKFAYHEPVAEQPFPLLVGGGPRPEQATFIHAEATEKELRVKAFSLAEKELGRWSVERKG